MAGAGSLVEGGQVLGRDRLPAGAAFLPRHLDNLLDFGVIDAGKDGCAAAAQEAAAAGDLRRRQAAFDQPVDQAVGVTSGGNNQDEFQGPSSVSRTAHLKRRNRRSTPVK
jgi:hypothetical protein